MAQVRFPIRVRPGASRTMVRGTYGEDQLVVAVTERAVDGKATEACLRAVAHALDLRPADLSLLSGIQHRTKILSAEVPSEDEAVRIRVRLAQLRTE
jgi:uncharacterized protein